MRIRLGLFAALLFVCPALAADEDTDEDTDTVVECADCRIVIGVDGDVTLLDGTGRPLENEAIETAKDDAGVDVLSVPPRPTPVPSPVTVDCAPCKIIIDGDGRVSAIDDSGRPLVGLPSLETIRKLRLSTISKASKPPPQKPPLQPLVTDFTPPPPPPTNETVHMCLNGEAPKCVTRLEDVTDVARRGSALHIQVHCGVYIAKGTLDLRKHKNAWIEGLPCPDGTLPRIELSGRGGGTGSFIEFTGMGGPMLENLRLERLRITGEGGRKSTVRLAGSGSMVINEMVIENQGNGVFASTQNKGDVWVVNSRFNMNGKGKPGREHHIYLGCKRATCRGFIVNSWFGGLYSKNNRQCSNQLRLRAREAYVIGSFFDGREGCVSRAIDTSWQNERLVIRDTTFIQGQSENSMLMMTPKGGTQVGEMVLENVVVASLREGNAGLIMNHVATPIRLKNVLYYHEADCGTAAECVVKRPTEFSGQIQQNENVRVTTDRRDLPAEVRDLLW